MTQTRHGKTRTEHGEGRRIAHVSSTLTTTVKKSFRSNGIVIFKRRIERTAGPLCSSCFFPNNLLLSPRPLLPRGITRQRFPLGNFSMRNEPLYEPTNLDASIPPLVQHFSLDFYYHFELMSYNRHILLLRIFTLILLLLPWLINVSTREDIKRERYATFFPRFYFPRLFLTCIVTILHFIIIYIFTLVLLL